MRTYTAAQEEIKTYFDNPAPEKYVVLNIQYMEDKNTRVSRCVGFVQSPQGLHHPSQASADKYCLL